MASGYVLIAVAVAEQAKGAVGAVGFYLVSYLFMNLGACLVVAQLERTFGSDRLSEIRGLGRRSPWTGAAMTLCLLSLAGIPPLAGYAGKVFLLSAAIEGGMTWLAVVGAANMAVGLYYYVRIIAEMYFEPPTRSEPVTGRIGYTSGLAHVPAPGSGALPIAGRQSGVMVSLGL